MSEDELPRTPFRLLVVPLVSVLQVLPFHFTMVPPLPAANTLSEELPQMP